jgi:hypothetical protein
VESNGRTGNVDEAPCAHRWRRGRAGADRRPRGQRRVRQGTDVAYGEEVTLEQNSRSSRFTVKVDQPREADYDAEDGMIALAVDIEASTEKGAPARIASSDRSR